MRNVTDITFEFDEKALQKECFSFVDWDKYVDDRYSDADKSPFEVVYDHTHDMPVALKESQRFIEYYGLQKYTPKTLYHKLLANSILTPHIDDQVQCAVNCLLHDREAHNANVMFFDDEGMEKCKYHKAVLNVSHTHGVKNGPYDRYMFKLSFYDLSYEQLTEIINNKEV
jgi:hypothetical protein